MRIHTPAGSVGAQQTARAAAPPDLRGRRIGILDNRKPNAGLLLGHIAQGIAERTGAEVAVVETKNAALAAPAEVLRKLTEEVDLVLTGSAD